jgi:hypothetical protein
MQPACQLPGSNEKAGTIDPTFCQDAEFPGTFLTSRPTTLSNFVTSGHIRVTVTGGKIR